MSTFPDPAFSASMYGGGVWSDNQHLDGARLDPWFSAPDGNVVGPGTNSFAGMEVAAPVPKQAFPAVQRMSPAFQPCSPPNWAGPPGPLLQHLPYDHPVRPHGDHCNSIGSLGMATDISRLQVATLSDIPGYPECKVMSPTPTPHSVWPLPRRDPVPAARTLFSRHRCLLLSGHELTRYIASTLRPRSGRMNLSLNTTTFQCLWTSGETRCTALITGDRRSITSHLRGKHNFTCDGQMIACAWDRCTTCMQRRNIPRHIVACHLEIKVPCPLCGLLLSRADANRKHQLACTGAAAVVEGEKTMGGCYFSGVQVD